MRGYLVCAWLAAAGCSESLARPSEVLGLRLLAIAADPPEAAPGSGVMVRALWHDDGAHEPPFFRWSVCPAPADGSVDRCAGDERPLGSAAGLDQVGLQAPDTIGTVLVRLAMCRALDALGACVGEGVTAAKRVVVDDREDPNRNPTIAAFSVTPSTADAVPAGATLTATLDAGPGSVQMGADGAPEALFVSWFATGGSFDEDRSFGPGPLSFTAQWTAPDEPGGAALWAVLRDGRGGVAWSWLGLDVE